MSGWIKIHRRLVNHWIWDNPDYLKWWLDILIEANHEDQKLLIKGALLVCKRGEKLYSLETWAKRWSTNKSKVKRFLDLLQKDEMILLKNETVTTRLTICKYDDYQDSKNESETQTKRKRNASGTQVKPIKECKEFKNDEEDINTQEAIPESEIFFRQFEHLKITFDELEKLKEKYPIEQINAVLDKIENYRNNKNYKSLYLTANTWLEKDKNDLQNKSPNGQQKPTEPKIGRMPVSVAIKNATGWADVEI